MAPWELAIKNHRDRRACGGRVMGERIVCRAKWAGSTLHVVCIAGLRRYIMAFGSAEPIRIQTRVIAHVDGVGQCADKPADSIAE